MPTTFTFKTIKTPRMNTSLLKKLVANAVQAEAKWQKAELGKTTASWKTKVKFTQQTTAQAPDLIVTVGPVADKGGQIWSWLNNGTKKDYPITAKNYPFLVYRANYSAATRVGKFSSVPAGSWGPYRRRRQVTHPGIEARDWTNILSERRQKPFRDRIFEALRKGANGIYP